MHVLTSKAVPLCIMNCLCSTNLIWNHLLYVGDEAKVDGDDIFWLIGGVYMK